MNVFLYFIKNISKEIFIKKIIITTITIKDYYQVKKKLIVKKDIMILIIEIININLEYIVKIVKS